MRQHRIAKTLARGAFVSWREQPTQYDIEALHANIERVGLVIRARWVLVALLSGFSIVAALVFAMAGGWQILLQNMMVPALALVFVLLYNALYQATFRKVGNIAFLNQAQLLFDLVVVTVLVHYSGGVYSWFASMYVVIIIEAAFILPRRADVWLMVGASSTLYAIVLAGDYLNWFPAVNLPFIEGGLNANLAYMLVRYLWTSTILGAAALLGMLMMKSIHSREAELREGSFLDDLTRLYNRQYFHRVLSTEAERARRDKGKVALILADVDRFGEVNRQFGVDVGDAILATIARRLHEVASADAAAGAPDVNLACRVGGEELALIVPEVARGESDFTSLEERALAMAEEFRRSVERTRVGGVGVTASVGVALLPHDGYNPDSLLDAADQMLSVAALAGGNTVRASWLVDASVPDDV